MSLFGAILGGIVGGAIDSGIGDDPIGNGVVIGAVAGALLDSESNRDQRGMSAGEAKANIEKKYLDGEITRTEYLTDLQTIQSQPHGRFKRTP